MMEPIEETDIRRRSKVDELYDYINDRCNTQSIRDWMNDPRLRRNNSDGLSNMIIYGIAFAVCIMVAIFWGSSSSGAGRGGGGGSLPVGGTDGISTSMNHPGTFGVDGNEGPYVHGNTDGAAVDIDDEIVEDGVGEIYDDDPGNPDLLQPVPTNVNIVMIGDSLSRYQYLSLVYFLRWHRWFEPSMEKANLVNEQSFISPFHDDHYGEFYFQSSRLVQPYELCDCYKFQEYMEDNKEEVGKFIIENRYYHDPVLNNTITFIHAYGHANVIHGRIPAKDAYDQSKWDWHKKEKNLVEHKYTEPVWEYEEWEQVITQYVAKIEPQPHYIVLNAGQWHNFFGPTSKEITSQLVSALQELSSAGTTDDDPGTVSFWKTTTYKRNGIIMNEDSALTDEYMCEVLSNCLDVSWTKQIRSDLYWDDVHFFEPVYRIMNEEMLSTMGYLPQGYSKLDRERLMESSNHPVDKPHPDKYDGNGIGGGSGSNTNNNKNDIEDDIDDAGLEDEGGRERNL